MKLNQMQALVAQKEAAKKCASHTWLLRIQLDQPTNLSEQVEDLDAAL